MKKVVVVSSNNNPDYLFYLPYIVKAWKAYGWEVAVMLTADVDPEPLKEHGAVYIIQLPEIKGLRTETIAQAGRLYAANYLHNCLLMTSDMDLLPLKDYWHPKENEITNYGHDLTDFTFMPMGYTAMSSDNWKDVMRLTGDTKADMLRDCEETKIAFSDKWEEWWNTDWRILTDRLKEKNVIKILRGRRLGSSFAHGRIDRGDSLVIPEGELIDMHCENNNVRHPDKLNKFLAIFNKHYGGI